MEKSLEVSLEKLLNAKASTVKALRGSSAELQSRRYSVAAML